MSAPNKGANIDQLEIAKDAEPVASTAIEAYRHALNVLADHLNAQATQEGSTSQLVWIDSDQNPWRNLVCPLAARSPCVSYAILATAAANIYVKIDPNSSEKAISLYILTEYRQRALSLLTNNLSQARRFNEQENAEAKVQNFRESLAATLLHWHLEMHFPSDSTWKIHLRTAQALVYSHCLIATSKSQFDECGTFLLQEFYCATIWPRLTLNIDIEDVALTLPLRNQGDAFIGFVRLMHRLILLASRPNCEIAPKKTKLTMSITELESEASRNRQSVLESLQRNDLSSRLCPFDDVLHVVDAWFYAILIFGYQVIGPTCETTDFIQNDCDCLFQALESLSSPLSFAQNQPWPLFIAGTECAGDKYRQNWVESRFQLLIQNICPLDRPRMLRFLKEWWNDYDVKSGYGGTGNWLEFIRRAQSHQDFIIW
ncbi:hypothetical protein PENSTE_c005G04590 [Penicillium steckii]|uniref:Transcription factor domain-containing protein n=1 Tax=Penicillium steckii TaxID=303698 RepID=A0A1V6TJX8_9EURO|nr:hypothetical protein PENSTE_c005G04590 [Penicillium steckii]